MSPSLRRYANNWLRWNARVLEHFNGQRYPAWWC
jgi:hypothetical protein